jgi:hypothetical protein
VDELSKPFHDLAGHMAWNHIYLSVRGEDYLTTSRYFLKESVAAIPPKIVVVVGAGASNEACGLPTGEHAAQRLIEVFKSRAGVSERLIEEEIHRITVEYRLERSDFETVLLALSKFDQKTVLHELNIMYSRRHYPSLTYEVLAHWLKHRFIDAIINFNFDELLDQAVDDELGAYGYYRVISDGDCPESVEHWQDKKRRFRFPLYIKPHGTASHKSTMRFTRSSYSLLPADFVRLLSTLFSEQVEVIIVGHAMQSVEFNDILARSGGKNLRFYALGYEKPELKVADRPEWDPAFYDTRDKGGIGHCVDLITTKADAIFKDGFKPRSIGRHRLISALFRRGAVLDEQLSTRDRQREEYLRDRVYVEISLAVSKAKGFVSLEHLARGRAGQYFRLLRKHSSSTGPQDSMLSMCANLRLEQFGYSRDTLCLPVSEPNAGRNRLRRPTLPKAEFAEAARHLALATRAYLSPERQSKCSENCDELYSALMEMYHGEEVEISSDTGATTNDVFVNPAVLSTLTSLYAQTAKMIKSSAWDSILCTAESGEWVLHDEWSAEIDRRQSKLLVIVADETYSQALHDRFGDKLADKVRWLPWWLHNRHVTVLLKDRKPVQAIFFERRLRTSHIVPMWLEGADAQIAMDAFVAYWIKANQYEQFGNEIEIRNDQLQLESDRLIHTLYAHQKQEAR